MPAVEGSASNTKPGVWASVTLAVSVAETPVYSLCDVVLAVWVMVAPAFAPSLSWAAVSVTVWRVPQFIEVNVSVFCTPFATPSVSPTVTAASSLVMVTVTSALGTADSRTV